MKRSDMHHDTKQTVAMTQQAIGTDTTTVGEIIDTAGFEGLELLLLAGTITDGAYATLLEEGDDAALADAATVDAEETLGAADFALAEDDTAKRLGYIGNKRYVRLSIVSTAVTTGVDMFGAIALLGMAAHRPTAD